MMKGLPISPGVTVAQAFRLDEALHRQVSGHIDDTDVEAELLRFEQAGDAVAQQLEAIITRVGREIGDDAASIFRSHRVLLRDPGLVAKVKNFIRHQKLDAATALQQTQEEYTSLFARISDEYLRERMADIRDVIGRVITYLTVEESVQKLAGKHPIILVAAEILPSQAIMFDRLPVEGIITEAGGSTGHAAILARSMGIPAVSGLRNLLKEVHTGDLVVVDGREGVVYINPGVEIESAYRKMQREFVDLRHRIIENRDQDAVTIDGTAIDLLANVNTVIDAATALGVGAGGVGLFRTEYTYLTHPTVPSEDEQYFAYRNVIEASPNQRVTIRTIDIGGDKVVPYLGLQREANPFMGWRSIRLTTEHPEFFQTQLRAILRASCHGDISILFPMVTTVEEIRGLKLALERACHSLKLQDIPYGEKLPFGIMIEVPAAAMCIDQLLDEVDFVSIGSNDLIQYMMAADRDNPKVAHLCEPCHPAILRILCRVIRACVRRKKSVTLCGEMAGRPICLLPLLGMGLAKASMSPAFVPTVKEMVRSIKLQDARDAARKVLKMRTVQEVRAYLSERVRELCPNVAKLEMM